MSSTSDDDSATLAAEELARGVERMLARLPFAAPFLAPEAFVAYVQDRLAGPLADYRRLVP